MHQGREGRVRVEYSSNNSGGSWWLKDEDWRKLEAAGWYVVWGKNLFCFGSYSPMKPPVCASEQECKGHRAFESSGAMTDKDRWLGALATNAHKDFPSLADAIRDWERVLGMDAADEGCGCCGPPHCFSSRDPHEYASGDSVVGVLYPGSPKSLREAAEIYGKKR